MGMLRGESIEFTFAEENNSSVIGTIAANETGDNNLEPFIPYLGRINNHYQDDSYSPEFIVSCFYSFVFLAFIVDRISVCMCKKPIIWLIDNDKD